MVKFSVNFVCITLRQHLTWSLSTISDNRVNRTYELKWFTLHQTSISSFFRVVNQSTLMKQTQLKNWTSLSKNYISIVVSSSIFILRYVHVEQKGISVSLCVESKVPSPSRTLLRSLDLWIKGCVKSRAFLLRRLACFPSPSARAPANQRKLLSKITCGSVCYNSFVVLLF